MNYINGETIRALREQKRMTQKNLLKPLHYRIKQYPNGRQAEAFPT